LVMPGGGNSICVNDYYYSLEEMLSFWRNWQVKLHLPI
jgi:hypothetical protein